MSSISIKNLKKAFGNVAVIKGVDLEIADKEFVVFVGPSGCGKSTMLRLIAGLEEATEGVIALGDDDVTSLTAPERGLAMVFQSYALYPHKTVGENMAFPLKVAGTPKAEVEREVARAAEILQLDKLLDRKPKELSGGQRQRVAIGRCIVRNPKAFLFDEPLSNLDAALRVEMRVQIARLHRQLDATMIYVTHDQVEAMTLADRIVVFSEGRIEQIGSPLELYENPGNLFVATFIGSPKMNILPHGTFDYTTSRKMNAGYAAHVGIRPEHVTIAKAKDGDTLVGIVGVTEHLGSDSFFHVDLPNIGVVVARGELASGVREGDKVSLTLDPARFATAPCALTYSTLAPASAAIPISAPTCPATMRSISGHDMGIIRRPKPTLSSYPGCAPITTPFSFAIWQVRYMVSGSPAWAPQATLILVMLSKMASSSPIRQGPKPSPRSLFRSIVVALMSKILKC